MHVRHRVDDRLRRDACQAGWTPCPEERRRTSHGKELGLTRERVRQIEAQALQKLRRVTAQLG